MTSFSIDIPTRFLIRRLICLVLLFPCSAVYANSSKIVVFGDSISAAYGMDTELGWVKLLADHLIDHQVINSSVSGETTGGGLVRLQKTLDLHAPDILILELGGNDGLRGYPIDKIEANLDAMARMAEAAGAQVLLVGMVLPPNYGRRYTTAFEDIFSTIATRFNLAFVPFILDGVATSSSLIQRDGIHPKPEAQKMIMEGILPVLTPLIGRPLEQR
ncbi:MAG: acyl-CoA thioesterase-1 [Patiriisocius sp.]|jgi:acyl-CoA thioesterase-1